MKGSDGILLSFHVQTRQVTTLFATQIISQFKNRESDPGVFFSSFKTIFMKRTLMLIALLFGITAASNAQSTYPIEDTVAAVAPHMPSISRYTGSSNCWHGLTYNYTLSSHNAILAWALSYPWEADDYKASIGRYIAATNLSTLSSGEADLYHDLRAAHMMVVDR